MDYPDSFIAEKAQSYLKLLTDLGPRVVGSYENEFLSVDILKREIELIQQQANKNHTIEVDIQVVTGSYLLGYKPNSIINAYSNVQNVVVKLSSRNDSESSVLVNAHFDSVPTSPGNRVPLLQNIYQHLMFYSQKAAVMTASTARRCSRSSASYPAYPRPSKMMSSSSSTAPRNLLCRPRTALSPNTSGPRKRKWWLTWKRLVPEGR